jgi:hypothetical protein
MTKTSNTEATMTELWRKFYAMTKAEMEAEQAEEFRRLEAGEMSDAELDERVAAWTRAGEMQKREGESLRRLARLAAAAGCPKGHGAIGWLLEQGLIVRAGSGYDLTEKGEGFRKFAGGGRSMTKRPT